MYKSVLGQSDVGIAKHQKGVQTYVLPSEDVYAAELLPVTLEAVLEMLDPLAVTRANLVDKTSAATPFDAAAGLAALTKHGIGLVTAHIIPNLAAVVGVDFTAVKTLES